MLVAFIKETLTLVAFIKQTSTLVALGAECCGASAY